jgi:hypothetical protein
MNMCKTMLAESLEHSSRVLRVMSWGRNPQVSLPDAEGNPTESSEKDTHASTLDKLLAWEKKLHDEVKVKRYISNIYSTGTSP